ncbi:MAG: cytochrome c3 family protein [Gallionellaceae bacterium]
MHRILLLSVLLAGSFFTVGSFAAGSAQPLTTADDLGPKVDQPIEFPHNRHAGLHLPADSADPSVPAKGGMEINCMYCHTYARRSMVAGIPPVRKCIGCHEGLESVRETPRIKKLFEFWDAKKPIPWRKVHDLPDFVRFNHERHIQRFVFKQNRPVQEACGYCHGDVKTMTVARRQKPLTMGWCASCHQKKHPLDDTSSTATTYGPNDCFTCHK